MSDQNCAAEPTGQNEGRPKLLDCEGCETLSCLAGALEWTDLFDDITLHEIRRKKATEEMKKPHTDVLKRADEKCLAFLKAHGLVYRRLLCTQHDAPVRCVEREENKVAKRRCSGKCSFSAELTGPLPISTKLAPYKVMVLFFLFLVGSSRSDAHLRTGIREGTVCSTYQRFEEMMATYELYCASTLSAKATELEVREILSGVHLWDRTFWNGDETTWGAKKYGVGKPTCNGSTQWFQNIAQIKKVQGVCKIDDYAIFPVADRKRVTLLKNIHAVVPRGSKIVTDCWRGYIGLDDEGFLHETVNHSETFKNPVSNCHTNHVESLHRRLKEEVAKRRSSKGKKETDRITCVLACSALYRLGRKDATQPNSRRGENVVQEGFKVVKWMAQEGVSVVNASAGGASSEDLSLTAGEADQMWKVVGPATSKFRAAEPKTDAEREELQLAVARAIRDASEKAFGPSQPHDVGPLRVLPSAVAAANAAARTPKTPRNPASPRAKASVATGGSESTGKKRGRPPKVKQEEDAPSPIPQTVTEWEGLTPEQDREAVARLNAMKKYIAESEHARLIMRAGDRDFVQDEESVAASSPSVVASLVRRLFQ